MPHLARHHQNSATGRVVLLKKEQYTCTQKAWFGIPLPVSVALENLLNLNNLWLSISSLVEERDIYVYTTQSWSRGQITMVNSMLGNKFKSSTWIFYFLLLFFLLFMLCLVLYTDEETETYRLCDNMSVWAWIQTHAIWLCNDLSPELFCYIVTV